MVERRTPRQEEVISPHSEYKARLEIDEDDLSACLENQPGLFHAVSEAYVGAVARRDAAKLELEQLMASLDEDFRNEAASEDRKLTEAAVRNKITAAPEVQNKEREYIRLKAEADKWLALKEAYQQRSFMLRELVALKVHQLYVISGDRAELNTRSRLEEAQTRVVLDRSSRLRDERSGSR